jgi:hypothetical protein
VLHQDLAGCRLAAGSHAPAGHIVEDQVIQDTA